MDSASGRSSVDDIVARLERLPTSWWQVKARIIKQGIATEDDLIAVHMGITRCCCFDESDKLR